MTRNLYFLAFYRYIVHMLMKEYIRKLVADSLTSLYPEVSLSDFSIEYPEDFSHGDYATNAALVHARALGKNPREIAEALVQKMQFAKGEKIDRVEIAGPGFINFYVLRSVLADGVAEVLERADRYGANDALKGKRVVVEYTDPNPFKEFHIGHFMTNAIGESLSRIVAFCGADTKRVNYQGDVGLHVAKAVWGMLVARDAGELVQVRAQSTAKKAMFLGRAYAYGAGMYEDDETVKKEIQEINKKIFAKSDLEIMALYAEGRAWSLEYFETIYARLGTKFDYYFFESEVAALGKELVESGIEKNIFERSDGAVVFHGEKYPGLHTRVFINSDGLPTYEAKELGLAVTKYEQCPHDIALVVTASEVADYFKVVLKALGELRPDLAEKIQHVPHGVLRLKSGKMSSRTGNVIRAEDLIEEVRKKLMKLPVHSDVTAEVVAGIRHDDSFASTENVAIGAIKYSILRQSAGKDIIFDFETSLSFEGDSGPYLQYTHARTCSILRKAGEAGIKDILEAPSDTTKNLERILLRFPDAVRAAGDERDAHYIATYLYALAQEFNAFYAHERIVDSGDDAPYRVALTRAISIVLKNGLDLLGMRAPDRM